jgi:type II secretory pathway component PulF
VPREDVALLEAGEATGNLDRSLDRLADRHDARRAARRRFLTETLYPLILFHLAAFLTPVPGSFARDGRLFGPTWLRTFALVLMPFWALVLAAAVLRGKARGRALLRRVVLALPGFGGAARRRRNADLAEILAAAYEAGMRIDRALEVAGRAVEDPRVAAAAADVGRGRPLAESLAAAGAVPAPLLARIGIGERAGDLSRALSDIAREEADAADHAFRRSMQILARGVYVAVALWIFLYAISTLSRVYSFAG